MDYCYYHQHHHHYHPSLIYISSEATKVFVVGASTTYLILIQFLHANRFLPHRVPTRPNRLVLAAIKSQLKKFLKNYWPVSKRFSPANRSELVIQFVVMLKKKISIQQRDDNNEFYETEGQTERKITRNWIDRQHFSAGYQAFSRTHTHKCIHNQPKRIRLGEMIW